MKRLISVTKNELRNLIDVALGIEKADLALMNGNLLNVYTGELLEGFSIAIKGRRIAYVGKDVSHAIGTKTEVIDAKGTVVAPGFIDAHTHLFWLHNVNEAVKYIVKGGTTTVITELMDMFFSSGYLGIIEFLDAAVREQPIKIFTLVPSANSISSPAQTRYLKEEEIDELFRYEEVIGLGETYWPFILKKDEIILDLFTKTISNRKQVEGHAAGAKQKKLVACASAGVSSCHESIDINDVIERLRLGLDVMIREGSIRRELEALSDLKDKAIDFRKLSFVTDGICPVDLIETGYMENIVQKAIDLGFDPVKAIQMATINPAQHFHLDGIIGGIAPFRYADVIIIPNLREVKPKLVISNGNVVAKNGKVLVKPKRTEFSSCKRIIRLPKKISPSEFLIQAKGNEVKVRVIEFVTDLVTKETHAVLSASNGAIRSDPKNDILKVALIDRILQPGRVFNGFVRGFKLRSGALATTAAWDTTSIVVAGVNELDMAKAVNRVVELGGGIALCVNNEIFEEIPLPIAGVISDLPIEIIAQRLNKINSKLKEMGCPFRDAHLTLATITSAAIPFIRINENGLVDVSNGKLLSPIM